MEKESVEKKYIGTKIRFPLAGEPYTDAVIEDVDKASLTGAFIRKARVCIFRTKAPYIWS